MLELPFLEELIAERVQECVQEMILRVLRARFGSLPGDLGEQLRPVEEKARLDELIDWAATCPNVDAFRERLAALSGGS